MNSNPDIRLVLSRVYTLAPEQKEELTRKFDADELRAAEKEELATHYERALLDAAEDCARQTREAALARPRGLPRELADWLVEVLVSKTDPPEQQAVDITFIRQDPMPLKNLVTLIEYCRGRMDFNARWAAGIERSMKEPKEVILPQAAARIGEFIAIVRSNAEKYARLVFKLTAALEARRDDLS